MTQMWVHLLGPSDPVSTVVNPSDQETRKFLIVLVEKFSGIHAYLGPNDPVWIVVNPTYIYKGEVM